MPAPRLAAEVTKDQIVEWLANALKCELFPKEGDSIANRDLPAVARIGYSLKSRNMGDETHVITLEMPDEKIFSILVKHGDYREA